MTITARYSSTCPNCGGRIAAGETVEWTRGEPARHAVCPEAPDVPVAEELPIPQAHTRPGRMLLGGELTATVELPGVEHVTVYARALRRGDEGWERVALTDPGARVRLAAAKRGQRIGWIGDGFRVDWDGAVTDTVKTATRLLFLALANPEIREVLPTVDDAGHITDPGGLFLPDGIVVRVANTCGRCGRELTQPESITRGIGPECYGKMTNGQHAQVIDVPRPAPAAVTPEPAEDTAELFGYAVTIYRSAIDGAVVVQIDTPDDDVNDDTTPRCRVDLNEAHLYEGTPIYN